MTIRTLYSLARSRRPASVTSPAAAIRLTRLHLASRRLPASLLALVTVAAALRITLTWTPGAGPYEVMFPLIVTTAEPARRGQRDHAQPDTARRSGPPACGCRC